MLNPKPDSTNCIRWMKTPLACMDPAGWLGVEMVGMPAAVESPMKARLFVVEIGSLYNATAIDIVSLLAARSSACAIFLNGCKKLPISRDRSAATFGSTRQTCLAPTVTIDVAETPGVTATVSVAVPAARAMRTPLLPLTTTTAVSLDVNRRLRAAITLPAAFLTTAATLKASPGAKLTESGSVIDAGGVGEQSGPKCRPTRKPGTSNSAARLTIPNASRGSTSPSPSASPAVKSNGSPALVVSIPTECIKTIAPSLASITRSPLRSP